MRCPFAGVHEQIGIEPDIRTGDPPSEDPTFQEPTEVNQRVPRVPKPLFLPEQRGQDADDEQPPFDEAVPVDIPVPVPEPALAGGGTKATENTSEPFGAPVAAPAPLRAFAFSPEVIKALARISAANSAARQPVFRPKGIFTPMPNLPHNLPGALAPERAKAVFQMPVPMTAMTQLNEIGAFAEAQNIKAIAQIPRAPIVSYDPSYEGLITMAEATIAAIAIAVTFTAVVVAATGGGGGGYQFPADTFRRQLSKAPIVFDGGAQQWEELGF